MIEKDWPDHHITDPRGNRLILRRIPSNMPKGPFHPLDLCTLTVSQRRRSTAVHELGHAVAYSHFGTPAAIQICEYKDTGAAVNPWDETYERMGDDQRILALAAGEAAEFRWLREHHLSNPMEDLVREILSQGDRKLLRDNFGVTFGKSGERDFDEIMSRANALVDQYWKTILRVNGSLADVSWWGWDESAERLGFSALVTPFIRYVSDAVRYAHGGGPGKHTHICPFGKITVDVGEEGIWHKISWD